MATRWDDNLARMGGLLRDYYGVTATLTPRVGSPTELTVVHTEVPLQIPSADGIATMMTEPVADVLVEDVSAVPKPYDQIAFSGTTYRIVRVSLDVTGTRARCALEEV